MAGNIITAKDNGATKYDVYSFAALAAGSASGERICLTKLNAAAKIQQGTLFSADACRRAAYLFFFHKDGAREKNRRTYCKNSFICRMIWRIVKKMRPTGEPLPDNHSNVNEGTR